MAWIEVHQTLARHPKLIRLSAKLRIHRAQSAGHLLFLWLWTLDYAPTGDLSAFGPAEISAAADYPGDAENFAQALKETGWIEEGGMLHDWHDYAGKLIEKREDDRKRKEDSRKKPQSTDVRRMSAGCPRDGAGTVPYLTVPKKEIVKEKSATPPPPQDFSKGKKEKRKHSFEDSPCFEFGAWCDRLHDWPEAKCQHYHERALGYSQANGGRYIDWALAVRNWDREKPWKPFQAPSQRNGNDWAASEIHIYDPSKTA